MIARIKDYLLLAAGAAVAVFYALLKIKESKIYELEEKNVKHEKLEVITDKMEEEERKINKAVLKERRKNTGKDWYDKI